MKSLLPRRVFYCMFIMFPLALVSVTGDAEAQLEDAISQLTGETTEGYLQPMITAFGTNLNSGWYHTASIPRAGLDLHVEILGMVTFIPEDDLTFKATPPEPWPQDEVETATVFGEEGTAVQGPGDLTYSFQDGQIQGDVVPYGVPQIKIGSVMGTSLIGRYFSLEVGDMPKLSLLGIGIQHNVSQWLPPLPVDIAAGIFYQSFDVGDIISSTLMNYGVQVSRSLPFVTFYGGLALESTKMTVEYTYEGVTPAQDISLKLTGDDKFRLTAGAALHLGLFALNADINIGSQVAACLGIGVSI
jgi:hypothetical protein